MTNDLNSLTPDELGLLFPIIIVEYNSDWPFLFQAEKQKILDSLGSEIICKIDHIGSTAVPGLSAKPTIDILIQLSHETNTDLLIKKLQKLNYESIPKPENPAPHLMLAKGYSIKGVIGQTFHIHLRYFGDWDEIIFRDFLIQNPEIAKQYVVLKKRLSINFKNNRDKYTDAKSDFVKHVTKTARDLDRPNINA